MLQTLSHTQRSTSFKRCIVVFIFILVLFIYEEKYLNGTQTYFNYNFNSIDLFNSNCPKHGIVTGSGGGRLGNHIWAYISIWLVGRHTGLQPYVPKAIKDQISGLFVNLSIPDFEDIKHCSIDPGVFIFYMHEYDFKSNRSITLTQYAFQPELMGTYYDEAIKQLNIRESLLAKSQEVLHTAKVHLHKKNPTFIAVHVRRTDYGKYVEQRFKAKPATVNFYKTAIEYMKNKYNNTIFIVVSDDPEWCAQQFISISDIFITNLYQNNSSPEQDLAILASCNHTILDYGTFGMWGALLAGGETVFYNVTSGYWTDRLVKTMKNWHNV